MPGLELAGDGGSGLIGASNAEEGLAIGRAIKRTHGDGRTGMWQAGPAGEAGGTWGWRNDGRGRGGGGGAALLEQVRSWWWMWCRGSVVSIWW